MYLDMSNWDGIRDEVFAEKVKLDYTSFYGGKPYTTAAVDQIEVWKGMRPFLENLQHIIT